MNSSICTTGVETIPMDWENIDIQWVVDDQRLLELVGVDNAATTRLGLPVYAQAFQEEVWNRANILRENLEGPRAPLRCIHVKLVLELMSRQYEGSITTYVPLRLVGVCPGGKTILLDSKEPAWIVEKKSRETKAQAYLVDDDDDDASDGALSCTSSSLESVKSEGWVCESCHKEVCWKVVCVGYDGTALCVDCFGEEEVASTGRGQDEMDDEEEYNDEVDCFVGCSELALSFPMELEETGMPVPFQFEPVGGTLKLPFQQRYVGVPVSQETVSVADPDAVNELLGSVMEAHLRAFLVGEKAGACKSETGWVDVEAEANGNRKVSDGKSPTAVHDEAFIML